MLEFLIKYKRYSFLILLSFAINCFGISKIQFAKYTVDDGLTHNFITSIYQDKDGFIWIGTRNGVNMFDGYDFKKFTSGYEDEHSIVRGVITEIAGDTNQRIWMSALGGGLCFYDKKLETFVKIDNDLIRDLDIMSMLIDRNNNLWVGHRLGVDVLDVSTQQVVTDKIIFNVLNKKRIVSLYQASNHNIFIGTIDSGMYIYNGAKKTFKRYLHKPDNPNGISHNTITCVYESSPEIFWIGTTNGGLNRFNIITETFEAFKAEPKNKHSITSNTVWTITGDNKKNIWVGTETGLNIIYEKTDEYIEQIYHDPKSSNSLSDNRVVSLYTDKYGVTWVGTRMGLNKQENNRFIHYYHKPEKNSLHHNNVHCFAEDFNGNIWIGTSQGIDKFKPDNELFSHVKEMEHPVLCIDVDVKNNLWLGTWQNGLYYYYANSGKFLEFSKNISKTGELKGADIFALKSDKNNNLWIGTWGNGLAYYNKQTGSLTWYKHNPYDSSTISNNYVCQIIFDDNNNLWIGAQDGINLLTDESNGKFKRFYISKTDSSHLGSNFITCIYKTNDNYLWASTLNGAHKLNIETGEVMSYHTKNGLASNITASIIEDNNKDIWVGTKNGLSKIKFNNATQIVNYNKQDGLQGNDFLDRAILKTSKGHIFIGGANGFNVLMPDTSKSASLIFPDIVFTQLDIYNNTINVGEELNNDVILTESLSQLNEISLAKKNNFITIHFSALHFKEPNRNLYKYKLENYEKNWHLVNANDRKATYANLDGGVYYLKVLATNSDGIWTKNPKTLKITIIPPIWDRIWFRIVIVFLAIVIPFTIVRWRFYLLQKQKRILETKVKYRTEEINKQKNILEQKNVILNEQKEELLNQKKEISEQAVKISQMNELLEKHNIELKDNVENLSKARLMQKLLSYEEFLKTYPDDVSCLKLVSEIKWSDGYVCKKCKSQEYTLSEENYSRRCKKCLYRESVTSGTIFHKIKFSLNKALYILILTSSGRNLNISKLAKELSLRLNTCWAFYNKAQTTIKTRRLSKAARKNWRELVISK